MTSYTIDNIIASTNLNTRLRLNEIAEKLENTEYNPENYPGVIWRPKNKLGVVVIMEDGRMMCTNVRSIEDLEKLFENLIKKMEELTLITPRLACPSCGAVVDSEDVVCIECGNLLQGG